MARVDAVKHTTNQIFRNVLLAGVSQQHGFTNQNDIKGCSYYRTSLKSGFPTPDRTKSMVYISSWEPKPKAVGNVHGKNEVSPGIRNSTFCEEIQVLTHVHQIILFSLANYGTLNHAINSIKRKCIRKVGRKEYIKYPITFYSPTSSYLYTSN